jgi:hypothetical protein
MQAYLLNLRPGQQCPASRAQRQVSNTFGICRCACCVAKNLEVPMAVYLAPRLLIAALTAFALLQFVIAQ